MVPSGGPPAPEVINVGCSRAERMSRVVVGPSTWPSRYDNKTLHYLIVAKLKSLRSFRG